MFREQILKIPQPIRFVLAGGTVFVVNTGVTLLLNSAGLHMQVAIPIGYVLGLCLHFTLQRYFVFVNHDAFSLAFHHQLGLYLTTAGLQYLFIALMTAVLPDLLGIGERVAYFGIVIVATVVTYLVNRAFVFHGSDDVPPDDRAAA